MSFARNSENQISIHDRTNRLTEREQRFLEKSWAKAFAEEVFPHIDEEPFSVLYSTKGSRPNTPVNVMIGAMVIKELLGLTEDEVLESLIFDTRIQYALHTTSFPEQPLSDRSLSRFRERCLRYETETGIDLIKECVLGLSEPMANVMGISGQVKRIDSMMVASNIRKLTRLELLYTCVANMVNALQKENRAIPDGMGRYCEDEDYNRFLYRVKSEELDGKFKAVLFDAAILLKNYAGTHAENQQYQLLERVIGEQATQNEEGAFQLKEKGGGDVPSGVLQNPSDPDATYRVKAGKAYRGYVANLEESVEESKSIITGFDYQKNTYSDSQFLQDMLEKTDTREAPATWIADGAYGSEENLRKSGEKKIRLVTTHIQGRTPADVFADFEVTPDGRRILRCAGGQAPITNTYYSTTEQCRITLDREKCEACPLKDECKPTFYKTKTVLQLSWKTVSRARQHRAMDTEEFRKLAKIRNGVETLPSVLRRKYDVDTMPVRGLMKTKLLFALKVAALNARKLIAYLNREDRCTRNAAIGY